MRVLLDESLPHRLKSRIAGHSVATLADAGWLGKKNGELLRLAEGPFDVFVTLDAQIPAQQNLANLRLGIVILRPRSSDLEDLLPLVPELLRALDQDVAGRVLRIPAGTG